MPRVIVNSTPLLSLGNIGKLDILHLMYNKIVIPEAVKKEVLEKRDLASQSILVSDWIDVETISNPADYEMYRSRLHAGEVEVMILAQQNPRADLVILDDMAARKTAEYLGLKLTGTIGVLIKAKQIGIITAVMPIINELECKGFFVSGQVKKMIAVKTNEDY